MNSSIPCIRHLLTLAVVCALAADHSAHAQLPFLWDNATGDGMWNTTSKNWHVITDPVGSSTFSNGMDVTFAAGTHTITIEPDTIEPGLVTIWAGDYTFQGGALTGAAQIVKQGSGTLVLLSPNANTGGVVIKEGIVNTRVQNAIGPGPVHLEGGQWYTSGDTQNYYGELHVTTSSTLRCNAGWTTHWGTIFGNGDINLIGVGFTIINDNSATYHGDWTMGLGNMFDVRFSGGLGTGTFYWNSGLLGSWPPNAVIYSNNIVLGPGTRPIRRVGDAPVTFAGVISGSGNLQDSEYWSGGTSILILSGENTYSGSTYLTNEAYPNPQARNVRLWGSLANANIHLWSTLRGGDQPGQQGTINYNVMDDETDLIQVYSGGHLDVGELILKVNRSGTQTSNEYVIADYTAGIISGGSFYDVQGLGDPLGGNKFQEKDMQWTVHYAGTDQNPGNKIVISSFSTIFDAIIFMVK